MLRWFQVLHVQPDQLETYLADYEMRLSSIDKDGKTIVEGAVEHVANAGVLDDVASGLLESELSGCCADTFLEFFSSDCFFEFFYFQL